MLMSTGPLPCGSVREHDSDGMMLHQAQAAQLQLEGGGSCILPSLSNVLLAVRTDALGAGPAAGSGEGRAAPAYPAGGDTGRRRVRREA